VAAFAAILDEAAEVSAFGVADDGIGDLLVLAMSTGGRGGSLRNVAWREA
jgi:hypothetical protein